MRHILLVLLATSCSLDTYRPQVIDDTPAPAAIASTNVVRFDTTSTSATAVPSATLTFTSASTSWLVLASARLGSASDSEQATELTFLVDGAVRATCGSDNAIAFASGSVQMFDWVSGDGEHTVEAQLRSLDGLTARVEDLWIVAAPLPRTTTLIGVTAPTQIVGGAWTEVARLDLPVGDYLALAYVSAQELPGKSSVNLRVRNADGDLWSPDFSNPRGTIQSFFVARRQQLSTGGGAITLEAQGSADFGSTLYDARIAALNVDDFALLTSDEHAAAQPVSSMAVTSRVDVAPGSYVVIQSMVPRIACSDTSYVVHPSFRRGENVITSFAHALDSCSLVTSYGAAWATEATDTLHVENDLAPEAGSTSTTATESVIHVLGF